MHEEHTGQLPLSQARCSNAKGTTKHDAPRSINHKATQNKNNTGTTAWVTSNMLLSY